MYTTIPEEAVYHRLGQMGTIGPSIRNEDTVHLVGELADAFHVAMMAAFSDAVRARHA